MYDTGINEHLGRRLRQRRRQLGMSQRMLADFSGVQFQQIQKYECGANSMSAQRLCRLAACLQAPASYFYQGLSGGAIDDADPKADETAEFVRVFAQLGNRSRRRLIQLMKAMHGDDKAPLSA